MMSSLQASCSVGKLWKVLEFRNGKTTVVPEKDFFCAQEQRGLKVRKTKDASE